MNLHASINSSAGDRRRGGGTLIELMLAIAIGGMVLGGAGVSFSMANRTFDAIGNYADLDRQSSRALDTMARDIRQTGGLTNFTSQALWFTNGSDGKMLRYVYDPNQQTLSWLNQSTSDGGVLLRGCTALQFNVFQRTPVSGGTMNFNTTTNPALAKVVVVEWVCQRTNYLSLKNSESVQTAKIVLRN